MDANHTLFEKDGVFGFHVSAYHFEQLVAVAEGMFTLYSIDQELMKRYVRSSGRLEYPSFVEPHFKTHRFNFLSVNKF